MIQFNQVTWYSKLMALIFFVCVLPVLAFHMGRQYEKTITYVSSFNTYDN